MHRLTALQVRNSKSPGRVHDGGGLYLQVTEAADGETVSKSWLLLYTAPCGRRREMGLGGVKTVRLGSARIAAQAARELLSTGVDPVEGRKAVKMARALEKARAITFRVAAETYIAAHRDGWRSAKHAAQWTATLETYAFPVLGSLSVAAIDVVHVLKALEGIWRTKPETASRVRGRIEAILDWATVRKYREGENPARWRGHLQKALPSRAKVRAVKHHTALPFTDLPDFLRDLRAVDGLGALALEFTILTTARSNEALRARWAEIDLDGALWTIPGERMKAGREHRVALSRQAVTLLRQSKALGSKTWVFPGNVVTHAKRGGREPLSNMAMLMTLRRMHRTSLTVHGFRSTFRDWAGETTNFPRELAEAALAHTLSDKTEAAYRRGDALEKRRKLMQAWADFCDRPATAGGGQVINLQRA